jgi:hypothetical protein
VSTLYGGKSCIAIARLEGGSLCEIADLAIEVLVLERQSIPPGTLRVGSASYLQNVGTTIFAQEWCNTVFKLSKKIRNMQIIPCIPILREDGPVPEIIDPVFTKTSQNARFLLSENERFGLVFVKTGSINSGTGSLVKQLAEISHWFKIMYEKNPLGCIPA